MAISGIPNQQSPKNERVSQYRGVYWHRDRGKWYVSINLKAQKPKYGGIFNDELDAAKRVNQLCKELGIPQQNPAISAMPNQRYVAKKLTSQYKGIHWNKDKRKWVVQLKLTGDKLTYGGMFKNELEAAKRVNQLCEEFGTTVKNPGISVVTNQPCQKASLDYDAMQTEFKALIKIFDENSDPATTSIKKNLIAAINYGEQTEMPEINLQTKNGESILSIAAKYGFSNAVKFLISKGAEKEHFTNEHHTPLSLAVSQNHLKVVKVLFEEWI